MEFLTREQVFRLEKEAESLRGQTGWRKGQCLFNKLEELFPEMAEFIRGRGADPFYDDERIPFFLETISETDIDDEILKGLSKDRNRALLLLFIIIGFCFMVFKTGCS